MRSIYFFLVFMALIFCACGDLFPGENEPQPVNVNVEEGKGMTKISLSNNNSEVIPVKDLAFIIIQDADTALYAVADGDTLAICDAVYHDPAVPWGAGKTVVVIKDNMAHLFIIIQDRDGALAMRRSDYRKDGNADIEEVNDTLFTVKNLHFDDGTTMDFDSNLDRIE